METNITQNLLKKLFDYQNGELYWNVAKARNIKIDDVAGTFDNCGYRVIGINGKVYKTHRLIFLYHHGFLPKFLDHIDGNPLNNNISNLREATNQENGMNREKGKFMNGKPTTSKFKGVCQDKETKKWRAQIYINGEAKNLGRYDSEIDAAKAYDKAAVELFEEFAKLNEV